MARVVSRFSVRYTVGSRSSSSISISTTVVRCWLGQMNSTRWGPLASKSPELVLVTGAPHCGHLICGSSCGGDSLMRVIDVWLSAGLCAAHSPIQESGRRASAMVGSNNSTGLPAGSSMMTCLPPTPTTMVLRIGTPAARSRSTVPARS